LRSLLLIIQKEITISTDQAIKGSYQFSRTEAYQSISKGEIRKAVMVKKKISLFAYMIASF